MLTFENIINGLLMTDFKQDINNKNLKDFVKLIINMIVKILATIDETSSKKCEMIFSQKHRKKLRISQFLLILTKIFDFYLKNNLTLDKELNSTILSSCFEIFEKVNLNSVRFYTECFFIQYSLINEEIIDHMLKIISDASGKTHMISSCLIVS